MQSASLSCINFNQLKRINEFTGELNVSLLYGSIDYQTKHGQQVIMRTREQLAKIQGCCIKTLGDLKNKLQSFNLIQIIIKKWYGKKRMFISCKRDVEFRINMKKVRFLNKYTGGTEATIMYLRFMHELKTNDIPCGRGEGWCRVPYTEFYALLQCSIKTCDNLKTQLIERGLIEAKGSFAFGGKNYFAKVNMDIYDTMLQAWKKQRQEEIDAKNKLKDMPKTPNFTSSINNRDLERENIINNNTESIDLQKSDIVNFENIDCNLSDKDWRYVQAAIIRTIKHAKHVISDVNLLMREVYYALTTPQHRKCATNFKHSVNIFMKLIRENRWRKPFGYEKYSRECKEDYDHIRKWEQEQMLYKTPDAIEKIRAMRGIGDDRIKHYDEKLGPIRAEKNKPLPQYSGVEYFEPDAPKIGPKPIMQVSVMAALKEQLDALGIG